MAFALLKLVIVSVLVIPVRLLELVAFCTQMVAPLSCIYRAGVHRGANKISTSACTWVLHLVRFIGDMPQLRSAAVQFRSIAPDILTMVKPWAQAARKPCMHKATTNWYGSSALAV